MAADLTLVVIANGPYLPRVLSHLALAVPDRFIARRIVVNQCAHPAFTGWVNKLGFDAHLQPGDDLDAFLDGARFVLQLPDDFLFLRALNVRAVCSVLDEHPGLSQMALRDAHTSLNNWRECGDDRGHYWLEHRQAISINPAIWRVSQLQNNSSGFSTDYPHGACGVWGKLADPLWVHRLGRLHSERPIKTLNCRL